MKSWFTAALCLIPFAAHADDFSIELTTGWHRQIQLMTDFIDRGISQTKGRPSIGSTIVYTFDSGLFIGGDAIHSTIAEQGVQTDLIGGWRTQVIEHWKYQSSFAYQNYPGTRFHSQNDFEFQQLVNYDATDWATLVAAVTFQPDAQQHAGFQTYSSVGVDFKLPDDFKLGGRVGYLTSEVHRQEPNYVDWTVTLSRDLGHGITLNAQYTGLTFHCSDCGNRFVGFISFQF